MEYCFSIVLKMIQLDFYISAGKGVVVQFRKSGSKKATLCIVYTLWGGVYNNFISGIVVEQNSIKKMFYGPRTFQRWVRYGDYYVEMYAVKLLSSSK